MINWDGLYERKAFYKVKIVFICPWHFLVSRSCQVYRHFKKLTMTKRSFWGQILEKEVKRKLCERRISRKSGCNSGDFFKSTFTFTTVLFNNIIWISPIMLSIPKTAEMDEETKTKKIIASCLQATR